MKLQHVSVIAVLAFVVGVIGLLYPKAQTFIDTDAITATVVDRVSQIVGAAAGPEHYGPEFFYGGATVGANCFSTTTTGTLAAARFENNSCFVLGATGAGQAAVTWTLPASTTLSAIIPKPGSCRSWFFDGTAVAAATTTTFVAGTGVNLVGLDATGAGTGADVIDGNEYGVLTMCREVDTDIVAFIQEWIHAD